MVLQAQKRMITGGNTGIILRIKLKTAMKETEKVIFIKYKKRSIRNLIIDVF